MAAVAFAEAVVVGTAREQATTTVTCALCGTPQPLASAESKRVASNVRRCSDEHFTVWRCSDCGSLHSLSPADLARYYELYPIFAQRMNYAMRCAFRTRVRFL